MGDSRLKQNLSSQIIGLYGLDVVLELANGELTDK